MSCRVPKVYQALLLAFCACSLSSVAMAQDVPMVPIQLHPQKAVRADGPALDRFEIYAGYGYIHPVHSDINGYQYQPVYNLNATVSMTGYFSRHFGLQVEGGYFSGPNSDVIANQCATNKVSCLYRDPSYYTAEAGPVMRWQFGRVVPFIHALGGGAKINGPVFQPLTWGWATTGGLGVDYILPFWHDRISVRPVQADFHYSQVNYGPLVLPAGISGGLGEIYAYKLSGGLVARFGSMGPSPQQLMLACPVSPASIYPGEPLSVMAQPVNLIPGRKATYVWTTTGGKLTAGDGGATIDTTGLPPGDYAVTGHVSQGRKAMQTANCKGVFTIRAYEPPTISCMATPSTVLPGGSSTIASNGYSPSGRQLTYTYTASAGQIVGTGSTGALSTAGVPPGTINVTCSLSDDLGKTATAGTAVTVTAPPAAALSLPLTQSLCSASFERDRRRPVRVDNEAKACLDDVALNMNRDPQAKLVVVGRYSADEQPLQGEQRSVNVRNYLQERGVDAGRIDLRLGDQTGRSVDSVIMPVGATYTDVGTAFDASGVHPPVYAAPRGRVVTRRHGVTRRKATHRTTRRRKKAK
jgi:hypothetical protein